jgi:hypothetical protein
LDPVCRFSSALVVLLLLRDASWLIAAPRSPSTPRSPSFLARDTDEPARCGAIRDQALATAGPVVVEADKVRELV